MQLKNKALYRKYYKQQIICLDVWKIFSGNSFYLNYGFRY